MRVVAELLASRDLALLWRCEAQLCCCRRALHGLRSLRLAAPRLRVLCGDRCGGRCPGAERVAVRVIRGERSWWRRRVGLPLGREAADGQALAERGLGAVTGAAVGAVVDYLEERALYARFGL